MLLGCKSHDNRFLTETRVLSDNFICTNGGNEISFIVFHIRRIWMNFHTAQNCVGFLKIFIHLFILIFLSMRSNDILWLYDRRDRETDRQRLLQPMLRPIAPLYRCRWNKVQLPRVLLNKNSINFRRARNWRKIVCKMVNLVRKL